MGREPRAGSPGCGGPGVNQSGDPSSLMCTVESSGSHASTTYSVGRARHTLPSPSVVMGKKKNPISHRSRGTASVSASVTPSASIILVTPPGVPSAEPPQPPTMKPDPEAAGRKFIPIMSPICVAPSSSRVADRLVIRRVMGSRISTPPSGEGRSLPMPGSTNSPGPSPLRPKLSR